MSESTSHRRAKAKAGRAKAKAAGKLGQTEVPLPGGRRLDAENRGRATEVERSGSRAGLGLAARRLRSSRKPEGHGRGGRGHAKC
jgi:hypothetical protein